MSNKELFKKAHEMAKEIKKEFPEVNYMFQFSLCLSYLRENIKEVIEEKVTWKTIEKAAEKYVEENGYFTNGWSMEWYVTNWKKGSHDRSYIEIREYRNGRLRTVKKCGYWDNIKEEYIAEDKYSKTINLLA